MGELLSFFYEKFTNFFPSEVRAEGHTLSRSNKIIIESQKEDAVHLKISLAKPLRIDLKYLPNDNQNLLIGFCSCSQFAGKGLCEHIWASLVFISKAEARVIYKDWHTPVYTPDNFRVGNATLPRSSKEEGKNILTEIERRDQILGHLKRVQSKSKIKTDGKNKDEGFKYPLYIISHYQPHDDHLGFDIKFQNKLKNGKLSKVKKWILGSLDIKNYPDPEHRFILRQLQLNAPTMDYRASSKKFSNSFIPFDQLEKVLALMGEKDCLHYENISGDIVPINKIELSHGHFQVNVQEGEDRWQLFGEVLSSKLKYNLKDPSLTIFKDSGIVCYRNTLIKVNFFKAEPLVDYLLGDNLFFRKNEKEEFLTFINQFDPKLWSFGDNFFLEKRIISPTPRADLEIFTSDPSTEGGETLVTAKIKFQYFENTFKPLSNENIPAEEAGVLPCRDYDLEEDLILWVESHSGLKYYFENFKDYEFIIDRSNFSNCVSELNQKGFEVFAKEKRIISAGKMHSEVLESEEDWFEIKGQIQFGENFVDLPEILNNRMDDLGLIQLNDGSFGVLPEKWIQRQEVLSQIGVDKGDSLVIHHSNALLLDKLFHEQNINYSEKFNETLEKINSFKSIKPFKVSPNFAGELRPYQQLGVNWLGFLQEMKMGGCLADDMGLGKTVQVLSFLSSIEKTKNKNLLICPRSLIFNWINEAKKFTPNLKVAVYDGPNRKKTLEKDCDLFVTTYGLVRRDIEFLGQHEFSWVILDEAQQIKNHTSQTTKACKLIPAEYRLALTGTPIENSILDLFSIFSFLNPHTFSLVKKPDNKKAEQMIFKSLRPFVLRRKKEQVLRDLPEKTENYIYCELSPEHQKIYADLKNYYQNLLKEKGELSTGKKSIKVLEALLRLRQAACHPGLIHQEYRNDSFSKIEILIDKIKSVLSPDRKIVVFSQFVSFLKLIETALYNEGIGHSYLDGQSRKREEIVHDFKNNISKKVFLISIKAGGVGLNLTEADYCFIVDPWWNPAVESQAIDRIHRIGQKSKVFAYRMIARGTVEEKIIQLQNEKKKIADALVSSDEKFLSSMDKADLEFLFS